MGRNKKYTKKHIDYLRKISPGRYNDEVTKMFNEKFGMNATGAAISTLRTRHGIKLGVPNRRMEYTVEQLAYLKELSAKGLFNREITERFNKKFGTKKTVNAISNQRYKYGFTTTARNYWKSGHEPWNKGKKGWQAPGAERTQFKKGHRPQTWVPVGSETVDTDGYQKVKIADPNKWAFKHRLVWERHNGRKIPDGHAVIFGDGNKRNFDPDNLLLVSRAQLCRMNQMGLIKDDARLTRVGALIADVHNKIGERKKKKGQNDAEEGE